MLIFLNINAKVKTNLQIIKEFCLHICSVEHNTVLAKQH